MKDLISFDPCSCFKNEFLLNRNIVPSKVIIIGTSGCGKTTFGNELSKILKITCTDLDDYYWLPNWQERNRIDFTNQVKTIISSNKWIICGSHSQVLQIVWCEADTIIWLDRSLSICLWRALKRGLLRVLNQKSCCNGNYETLTRLFSRKSILLWIWNTYSRRKKDYEKEFLMHNSYQTFVRLKNSQEIKSFFDFLTN